jgi:hypothetical protein
MVKKTILIVGLFLVVGLGMWQVVRAEECDNPGALTDSAVISGCISKYSGILDAIAKANTTNQQELDRMTTQIANLKLQIANMEKQLVKLGEDIFAREVKIGVQQELLSARVKRDYIRKRDQPILMLLFSSQTAQAFFTDLAYREKLARNDREVIG